MITATNNRPASPMNSLTHPSALRLTRLTSTELTHYINVCERAADTAIIDGKLGLADKIHTTLNRLRSVLNSKSPTSTIEHWDPLTDQIRKIYVQSGELPGGGKSEGDAEAAQKEIVIKFEYKRGYKIADVEKTNTTSGDFFGENRTDATGTYSTKFKGATFAEKDKVSVTVLYKREDKLPEFTDKLNNLKSEKELAQIKLDSNEESIKSTKTIIQSWESVQAQAQKSNDEQATINADATAKIVVLESEIATLKINLAARKLDGIQSIQKVDEFCTFFEYVKTFITDIIKFDGTMPIVAPVLTGIDKSEARIKKLKESAEFGALQITANQDSIALKNKISDILTPFVSTPINEIQLESLVSQLKKITNDTEILLDNTDDLRNAIRDIVKINKLTPNEKKDEIIKVLRPMVAIPRAIFMEKFSSQGVDFSKSNPLFVMGATGSGKSTILNHARGYTLATVTPSNPLEAKMLQVVNPDGNECQIGTSRLRSETIFPMPYQIPDFARPIVDCPGFGDTRGPDMEICVSALRNSAISKSSLLSIVIVLDLNEIRNSARGKGLKDLLNELLNMGGHKKFDQVAPAFSFVINKALIDGTLATVKQVIDYFINFAKTEQDPFLQLLSAGLSEQNVFVIDPLNEKRRNVFLDFLHKRPTAASTLFKGTTDPQTKGVFFTKLQGILTAQETVMTKIEAVLAGIESNNDSITEKTKTIEIYKAKAKPVQGASEANTKIADGKKELTELEAKTAALKTELDEKTKAYYDHDSKKNREALEKEVLIGALD